MKDAYLCWLKGGTSGRVIEEMVVLLKPDERRPMEELLQVISYEEPYVRPGDDKGGGGDGDEEAE